jgi:hypothetical protein
LILSAVLITCSTKRIVLHLVQHKEVYLNSSNDARTFAMFSEFFSGEVLSEIAIQRIFEQEVYEERKPGTYMGACLQSRVDRRNYRLYGMSSQWTSAVNLGYSTVSCGTCSSGSIATKWFGFQRNKFCAPNLIK